MFRYSCCFTGHRQIRPDAQEKLAIQLPQLITGLCSVLQVRDFFCGGALGFDMLAGETVLAQKALFPDVRLHMVLPCPEQSQHWPAAERARYQRLLEEAYTIQYAAERYNRGCMLQRNRMMVDSSTHCVAYLEKDETGGTAYTVRYAVQQGKAILRVGNCDYGEIANYRDPRDPGSRF